MPPPLWVKKFKNVRYSITRDDNLKVFDALCALIENKDPFPLWKSIGILGGYVAIMEFFAKYNTRGGRWSDIHSDQICEDLLTEIKSAKRKTLE